MLVGLDIGTTGVKAVVFDDCATILASAYEEYPVITGPGGMAEQDAENVWRCARSTLVRAVSSCGVKEIRAIGISVQGDAIIPVDASGAAVHRALLGMDYRSAPTAMQFSKHFGDRQLFERTGMRPHAMNSITKIAYLRELSPSVFDTASAFVTYAEFIAMKLGGERCIDRSMASRTMAYSVKDEDWDDEILSYAGVDRSRLGTISSSGTVVGTLSPSLSREMALVGSTMIAAGGHDQCCAALGAGVTTEHLGVVSTGTAEVFSTCLDTVSTHTGLYESYFPCYHHVLPDTWFTFSLNHVGGLLLRWFRDTFCAQQIIEARRADIDIYRYLDLHMATEAQSIFIIPHFNGSGTPWCDMDATGAIVGLTLSTGIGELYRALLESQTYELALNLEAFEQANIAIDTISAVGGGARSAPWLQIKADILNRLVRVPACQESAALGAAVLAGSSVGLWKDIREGVDNMVGFTKEYEPQIHLVERYRNLFEAYRSVYPTLKQLRRSE
jgi:xylulokinase